MTGRAEMWWLLDAYCIRSLCASCSGCVRSDVGASITPIIPAELFLQCRIARDVYPICRFGRDVATLAI